MDSNSIVNQYCVAYRLAVFSIYRSKIYILHTWWHSTLLNVQYCCASMHCYLFFLAHSFYENTQETQPVMNTIVHWVFWDWPPTISARLCLLTFGTAAWKTNSVISASVELEAWMVMTATFGLGLALSNVKSIFRPFLLYAVIGGIPMWRFHSRPSQDLDIHFMESLMVMAKYFNT